MLNVRVILFSISMIFLIHINLCNATVSCTTCSASISINLTIDKDLNTSGCTLQNDEICSLMLRIDYTNSNNSFALLSGSQESVLVLTNGEPQVSEVTFIWFNELRVQRIANILCFAGTSCGVDLMKQIYRDRFRLFDYNTTQHTLSTQLFSSSASGSSLTCEDPSGSSISCADGFCRSISDGNGIIQYSSCVKKGVVPNPFGITITKSTMSDLGGDQIVIMFTCNKPLCNSKENIKQVLQNLVAAKLIPEPVIPTTTPRNEGITTLSSREILSFTSLFLFSKYLI